MTDKTHVVDEMFDKIRGHLDTAIVCGFDKDGNTFIQSSVGNVPFMHWMLNSAIFELGLFQKQQKAPTPEVDAEAAEE
jgi:tryptophanyl-tRNA synthetase